MADETGTRAQATPHYTAAELTSRRRWAVALEGEHPTWRITLDSNGAFTASRGSNTATGSTIAELEHNLREAEVDAVLAKWPDL